MGVLYRAAEFLRFLRDQPLSTLSPDNGLSEWHGIAILPVLETAEGGGWVWRNSAGEYHLSARGELLATQPTPAAALREMVIQLVADVRPSWTRLAMRGRAAVLEYAPPEVVQCLVESGLAHSVDFATVGWWDRLSVADRSETDQDRLDEGRHGERLSYEYECLRTGFEPRWVALENSTTGYDLLSVVSGTDSAPLVIEVKTTTRAWSAGKLWLTRNEWSILSRSDHAKLHLWGIAGECLQFGAVEVNSLSAQIPVNQGAGEWEVLSIGFADIASEFTVATTVQDLLVMDGI